MFFRNSKRKLIIGEDREVATCSKATYNWQHCSNKRFSDTKSIPGYTNDGRTVTFL